MNAPHYPWAVREPSSDDPAGFTTFDSVWQWARVRGDVHYRFSEAGSLMQPLGCDQDTDAAEFAPISPHEFGEAIDEW